MTDGTMTDAPARSRRGRGGGGGADARRAARAKPQVMQMPAIQRSLKEFEVLDEEALSIIENNADKVLEEIGIGFKDYPRALDLWEKAGATVDRSEERVRFPRGMLRELIKTAPSHYTQHARNPERSVPIGGKSTVFAPVYGPPFVSDIENGRRYATIEDFNNFVKLAYANPYMHHSGGTVCEPCDIAVNKRHLDMVYAHIKYSDKPFMGSVTAPERAQDTINMCNLVFGEEFVQQNTVLTSLINCNSPMTLDGTMLGALDVYAQNNQACIVSPFILAGAMSPVTVTGTLTQVLCEVRARRLSSARSRPTSRCRPALRHLERRNPHSSFMARLNSPVEPACLSVPAVRFAAPKPQTLKRLTRVTRRLFPLSWGA